MVVVVTHEFNMALYFLEAGNGSNAGMCFDVAGRLISGSGDVFELSAHRSCTLTISPLTSTIGNHIGFDRDYKYHTAFRTCYVIMHKVYRFRWSLFSEVTTFRNL